MKNDKSPGIDGFSAKQVLSSFKYRSLTPFGKITILKTLVLSKFNHLFASIVSPQNCLKELNKTVFRYLWDGKPEKINQKRADLVDKNYKMLSFENLKVKYNLNANILNYYTIRKLLTKFLPKAYRSVY